MSFLESVTGEIVSKALDFSLYKHGIIANNIANANVKGYAPKRVDFTGAMAQLKDAVESNNDDTQLRSLIPNVSALEWTIDDAALKVSIDKEMVELTKNTLHYQALLRARSELGEIRKMSITGGR